VVYDEEISTDSLKIIKRKVYLNSSNNENIFSFEVKNIEKIIDKLISEGKVTLILNLNQKNISNCDLKDLSLNKNSSLALKQNINSLKQNYELENYIIFISQSTKEILENFLKYIKNYNQNQQINNIKSHDKINLQASNLPVIEQKKDIINSNSNNIRFGQKRKYQELYKKYENKNNTKSGINDSYNPNSKLSILNANQINLNNNIICKNQNNTFNNKFSLELNNNKIKIKKSSFDFKNIPDIIFNEIFVFLDKGSSNNFSLINKQIKKIHDGFMENLELRADTPADMFGFILSRFDNLRYLKFGKGKKIKNEIFKNFNSNLKNLISLDISQLENLNENSITKILSKTKPVNIKTLKLNFDLNCLNPILSYILTFTLKLEEFKINSQSISYYLKTKDEEENLENLLMLNKISSMQYHKLLLDILNTKLYMKDLEIFLFNFSLVKTIIEEEIENNLILNKTNNVNEQNAVNSNQSKFDQFENYKIKKFIGFSNIFSNLEVIYFEIIIIKQIKDLLILQKAVSLKELTIKNILYLESPKNLNYYKTKSNGSNNQLDLYKCKLKKINFKNFQLNIEEIERNLNTNFNYISNNLKEIVINDGEGLEFEKQSNLKIIDTLDLDDDFVEIFIQIFSQIRNLTKIEMGEFINGDILRVICNFSKNISEIKLNSNLLIDDDINFILRKMINLEILDLRGCMYIYGNCFVELDKLPEKLKKVKLSLQSFNFHNLIEYLRNNNIEAQNYI